jgi:hypothetical protein
MISSPLWTKAHPFALSTTTCTYLASFVTFFTHGLIPAWMFSNMKIGDSDSYHYDLRRSGLFPVGSKCTADDRAQILKNYKHIYLADTLKDLPSAHVTDETVEYDDRSCMTPAKCQGKADYTCDSSGNFAGFCLDGLDRKCAPGTFCSKAFHKKFPTKDPCITTSTSYGCNKATKQCEIHAGYQNQTECVEDTSCTH